MGATLYDMSLMEHTYLVGIAYGAESVGNGYGGALLHQSLQCILYQALTLGIECRCGFVEYEYWRIFQYRTCNADTLTLTARQASATVADIGIKLLFALHDEVVGIGYACGFRHLFIGGSLHTEGNIVAERVVEEYRLLVHITDQLSQILYAEVFHIDAIDKHFALLHIVIAGNEIDQCRFAATALSYQGNGFSLWNGEVDMSQLSLVAITERHIAQFNLMFKLLDMLRMV